MEAKELGNFIAANRKKKEITQAELAKRLNVTDKAVSRWERGLGFPDINTLEPLADALGVTLTELMKCSNEMEDASDEGIIASIEIAKIQRQKARKKLIVGGLGCMIGLCFILYAVKLFVTHSWSLMFDGSDGATAVFVAGRIGNFPPVAFGILGILALLFGMYAIWRSNNNDK